MRISDRKGHRGETIRSFQTHSVRVLVLVVCITDGAAAQQRNRDRGTGDRRSPQQPAAALQVSAPHKNLLQRAQDGIARRDWKFAIDSLQRIIEDPVTSLSLKADQPDVDSRVYESVKSVATRLLAELPPEGLEAYRVLYDGKAARLYDRAVREHDPAALRKIVDYYLMTDSGDLAIDTLATWALNEGDPGAALAWLDLLSHLVPNSDIPKERIALRRAVALALCGRVERASRELSEDNQLDGRRVGSSEGVRIDPHRLAEAGKLSLGHRVFDWAMMGGSSDRRRRMPAVKPSFVSPVAWRFDASGGGDGSALDMRGSASSWLPPVRLVLDQELLFLRTAMGVSCLHAGDLSELWNSTDAEDFSATEQSNIELPQFVRDPSDEVAAAISVFDSKVFTIERPFASGATAPLRRGRRTVAQANARRIAAKVSRLVARDTLTGEVVWTRGITGDSNDPLDTVQFRSAPVLIKGKLWTIVVRGNELLAALLNPEDGSLDRLIYLDSMQDPRKFANKAMVPAVASGTVFVPTPHGVLFAMDAASGLIRWAVECGVHAERGSSEHGASSTPVVADGLALFIPVTDSRLFGIDAYSGEVVYSVPVDSDAYIVAADRGRVWIGGSTFYCLSTIDSAELWSMTPPEMPSGRAVCTGEHLLLPTVGGLRTIRADDGTDNGIESTEETYGALESLLSVRSALYSYGPYGVRKFPDIEALTEELAVRLVYEPHNHRLKTELAWLMLWKGDAARCLELLDEIDESDSGIAGDVVASASRLRIEAVLDSTEGDSLSASEAIALARTASNLARSPYDKLRTDLALAELLAHTGNLTESWRTLWATALNSGDASMMPLQGRVSRPIRSRIRDQLKAIEGKMSAVQLATVDKLFDETVATVIENDPQEGESHRAVRLLSALTRIASRDETRRKAERALALQYAEMGLFEQSEQTWRDLAQGTSSVPAAASAHAHRCLMYERIDQRDFTKVLDCLDEVAERHGPLNCDTLEHFPESAIGATTVAEWATGQKSRILKADGVMTDAANTPHALALSGDRPWSLEWDEEPAKSLFEQVLMRGGKSPPPRLLQIRGAGAPHLRDRVLLINDRDKLCCLSTVDSSVLWQTRLKPPSELATQYDSVFEPAVAGMRYAVAAGPILLVNGTDGLFALGMQSGKRMWVRPYSPMMSEEEVSLRDQCLDARDGHVVAMTSPGRLSVFRLVDGSTVWDRLVSGRRFNRVRIVGETVVAFGHNQRNVWVYSLNDGRLIDCLRFRRPSSSDHAIEPQTTSGLAVGMGMVDEHPGLMAMSLTTGQLAWTLRLEKPLAKLAQPASGYIAAGLLGGDVLLVNAATGEVVLQWRIPGATALIDAVLVGPAMIVQYIGSDESSEFPSLASVDLASGETNWQLERTAAVSNLRDFRSNTESFIPVLIGEVRGKRRRVTGVKISTIEASTGESVGNEVRISLRRGRSDFGEAVITRDAIVAVTQHSLQAYGRTAVARSAAGDGEAQNELTTTESKANLEE